MLNKLTVILFVLSLTVVSCNTNPHKDSIEKWKQEITQTEQDFAKMAKEEGIYKAFTAYAAEDAVINRNEKLISGKQNIDLFYKDNVYGLHQISSIYGVWGRAYSYIDSTGNAAVEHGVFHTVWKKQPDGTWRFVWD